MDVKNKKAEHEKIKEQSKPSASFITAYILMAICFAAVFALVNYNVIHFSASADKIISKFAASLFFAALVLIFSHIIEAGIKKSSSVSKAYNLIKVVRLITIVVIVLIIISFLNQNWYTAAVSLGLISLILGFALQSPIASFIGWFYIIVRVPYKVGDRIQLGEITGDVVEINYLDTTLWEFGGDYMSNDISTGRLIRFPNSLLWQTEVYNYSWKKFPYIWNEIPFHIAYESDLTVVEKIMRDAYIETFGTQMKEEVKKLSAAISQTPVDEPDISEYPLISFKINDNTWVEALIVYLVEPKQSSSVRTVLIKKILNDFLQNPDKIMFPKSNSR